MPGYLKSLPNKFSAVCLCLASLIAAGCGASGESAGTSQSMAGLNDFLSRSEKTFNPSLYDADLHYLTAVEQERHASLEIHSVFTTAVPETVAGYRAQVFFSNNIDSANSVRDRVEQLLPAEWTYIIFDVPYYRVRVGNYTDRSDAEKMVRTLDGLGFRDSWAVPDNIILNLPSKPPAVDMEPEPRHARIR